MKWQIISHATVPWAGWCSAGSAPWRRAGSPPRSGSCMLPSSPALPAFAFPTTGVSNPDQGYYDKNLKRIKAVTNFVQKTSHISCETLKRTLRLQRSFQPSRELVKSQILNFFSLFWDYIGRPRSASDQDYFLSHNNTTKQIAKI